MPDITMCLSTTCPMRGNCYRAQAKPSIRQSFFIAEPLENGTCEYYWPLIPPIDTETKDKLYKEAGFSSRSEYLASLAEDYGVNYGQVAAIATILGRNEDFDGLISALEDRYG